MPIDFKVLQFYFRCHKQHLQTLSSHSTPFKLNAVKRQKKPTYDENFTIQGNLRLFTCGNLDMTRTYPNTGGCYPQPPSFVLWGNIISTPKRYDQFYGGYSVPQNNIVYDLVRCRSFCRGYLNVVEDFI